MRRDAREDLLGPSSPGFRSRTGGRSGPPTRPGGSTRKSSAAPKSSASYPNPTARLRLAGAVLVEAPQVAGPVGVPGFGSRLHDLRLDLHLHPFLWYSSRSRGACSVRRGTHT